MADAVSRPGHPGRVDGPRRPRRGGARTSSTALRRQAQRTLPPRARRSSPSWASPPSAVDAWDALATVHRFGGRAPGPVIVGASPSPGAEPRLDARVSAPPQPSAAGHGVWFEDIVLSVGGPAAGHLASLLEPFTLPDLPVAVWYPGGRTRPDDACRHAPTPCWSTPRSPSARPGGRRPRRPRRFAARRRAPLRPSRPVRRAGRGRPGLAPPRALAASCSPACSRAPTCGPPRRPDRASRWPGRPAPGRSSPGWLASPPRRRARPAAPASTPATPRSGSAASLDGVAGTFSVDRVAGERQVRAVVRRIDGGAARTPTCWRCPTPISRGPWREALGPSAPRPGLRGGGARCGRLPRAG